MAQKSKSKGKSKFRPVRDGKGTKQQRRTEEIIDTSERMSSNNDISWYSRFAQLVIDAASYPFAYPVGTRFRLNLGDNYNRQTVSSVVPGIMVLRYQTAVPTYDGENAPVNIAMRNIYSFIRHANSGSANYEAPDLMLYLLAMDSVYSAHAFLKRVYGLARLYGPTNRYYPAGILSSLGFNIDDVQSNLANLRMVINTLAVKLGSMCVPQGMPLFDRHIWMNEGIYVDSDTTKPQSYLFDPSDFYKFTLDSKGVGSLGKVVFSRGNGIMSFASLVMDMMNTIITNEDMNIMSGDILKAFKMEGVRKIELIPEDYVVLPTYSKEVLTQIENATVWGSKFNLAITQNTSVGGGYLLCNEAATTENVNSGANVFLGSMDLFAGDDRILNFHWDSPSPADVMVATRLVSQGYRYGEDHALLALQSYGTEIINNASIYTFSTAMDGTMWREDFEGGISSSLSLDGVHILASIANFDWAPLIYVWNGSADGNLSIFGDLDTYTVQTTQTIMKTHETAALSLFDIPQVALIK